MVNHGLVVAPLFFIIALLAARAGGTDDLRKMGGLAFRAPVLAALFLIVALATLAMPGSANFVGEFLILTGVLKAKIVYAIVAGRRRRARGRLHDPPLPALDAQPARARAPSRVTSSTADGLVIVPVVAVILVARALSAVRAASAPRDAASTPALSAASRRRSR